MHEFLVLVDRREHGTPAGDGIGIYEGQVCPQCGIEWTAAEKIGTRGRVCPECYHRVDCVWMPVDSGVGGDTSSLWPVGWQRAKLSMN